jgi:hypothetical protein
VTKYPTDNKDSNNPAHYKYSDFEAYRSYMTFNVGTINTGEILEDFKQELNKKKNLKKSRRTKPQSNNFEEDLPFKNSQPQEESTTPAFQGNKKALK